jgi:hypothetical protein
MFKLKLNKKTEQWYKFDHLKKPELIKDHVLRLKDQEGAYLVTIVLEKGGVYNILLQKMFPHAKNSKDREPFYMTSKDEYRIIGQQ